MAREKNRPMRRALAFAVFFSVALGAGVYFGGRPKAPFEFLRDAQLVAIDRDQKQSAVRAASPTATYLYTSHSNWLSLFARAKAQLPGAMERPFGTNLENARQLVLPRQDGDRVSIMFPPDQIVLVAPGRMVLNKAGKPVLSQGTDADWSTIEVLDFRQDSPLDALAHWIRGAVPI